MKTPPFKTKMRLSDARRASEWFLRQFGLDAWKVFVHIGEPPENVVNDLTVDEIGTYHGRCAWDLNSLTADIWLNLQTHTSPVDDLLTTLFHELVHIFIAETDQQQNGWGARTEWLIDRWADVLAARYREILRARN